MQLTESTTPLNDAYQGGTFICIDYGIYQTTANIRWANHSFEKRGLLISNESIPKEILGTISYFRLANYFRPMETDKLSHIFKPGSLFENTIQLYEFDNSLWELIFMAIARIEIAFRTKMMHSFPWHMELFGFLICRKQKTSTSFLKTSQVLIVNSIVQRKISSKNISRNTTSLRFHQFGKRWKLSLLVFYPKCTLISATQKPRKLSLETSVFHSMSS